MSEINKHVYQALDTYCKLTVEPEYAVLLNGSWGCGKSHFVEEFIEQHKDYKFLFVSLYGIATVDAIEDKFFQQLNPVLSNKKMVLAGRIGKGLLKGTLKLDLDDDGKGDANLKVGIPDINIADYLTDIRNCILVFDDLERCTMELDQILGYINYFVEKDGYKVILIADESKLLKRKSLQKKSYLSIKEKLVGKTLTVQSDFNFIFESFIQEIIEDNGLKELLKANKEQISSIFYQSGYNNFRSLRKTLIEITRFYQLIDLDLQSNTELASSLIQLFIVLSFEIYSGKLSGNDLNKHLGSVFGFSNAEEAKIEQKYDYVNKKYRINIHNTFISPSDWQSWFTLGVLEAEQFNTALRSYLAVIQNSSTDLSKLLDFYSLESKKFDHLKVTVWNDFINKNIIVSAEILKLVELYIFLSRSNLVDLTIDDINSKARQIVSSLASQKSLDLDWLTNQGAFVCAKHDWASKESIEFKEYLILKGNEQLSDIEKSKSPLIVDAMKNDMNYFYELMNFTNQRESFADKPILNEMDKNEFIEILFELSNADKNYLFKTLQERYQTQTSDSLNVEREWMLDVLDDINKTYLKLRSFDAFVLNELAKATRKDVGINIQQKDK